MVALLDANQGITHQISAFLHPSPEVATLLPLCHQLSNVSIFGKDKKY